MRCGEHSFGLPSNSIHLEVQASSIHGPHDLAGTPTRAKSFLQPSQLGQSELVLETFCSATGEGGFMLFLLVLNLELCKPATCYCDCYEQEQKRKEEKGRMKDEKN